MGASFGFDLPQSVQKVSNAGEFSGKLWERVDQRPLETLENIRVCHLWEITEPTRSVFNRTHNRSVAGSIPARPTNLDFFFCSDEIMQYGKL